MPASCPLTLAVAVSQVGDEAFVDLIRDGSNRRMLDNPQMRVAVALLVDDELSNRTWKTTMHWHKYGFDFRVLRLPPHISLKQPFIVPSLTSFEAFFDRLAEQTNAQPIFLDGFRLYESGDEAVVVLNVLEDAQLRDIHYSLNQALIKEFGPTPADFDGDDYKFHLTVAIGRYQAELKEQLLADITATSFRERTVATRLAMFVYKESQEANALYGTREYGTYKIRPLKV